VARVLALLAALVLAPTAHGELVAPGIFDGALAADGSSQVAYASGGALFVAAQESAWQAQRVARLPGPEDRVAAFTGSAILTQSRLPGRIRLAVRERTRWRTLVVANATPASQLGNAGLALDRAGRPAVAFARRNPRTARTSLWLIRYGVDRRLHVTRVTRMGFPVSATAPSAAPVLMPDGTLRVVQSFTQRGANAILWRREGARWWGRVLHASAAGLTSAPVFVAAAAAGVYVAWSVGFPAEAQVVLSSMTDRSRSAVLHRTAFAAGLVLGPNGPEVAANEPTDAPTPAGYLLGGVNTELDGRVLGYALAGEGRQLLLGRPGGLEWFALPAPPAIRVTLAQNLTGRLEGASGPVQLYLEAPTGERTLAASVVPAADGSFAFPASLPPGRYRAVFVDGVTGVPYGALLTR
jgi:hypothetical protein